MEWKTCCRFAGALCAFVFISDAYAQSISDQVQREHEQRLREQQERDKERSRRDQSTADVFLQPLQQQALQNNPVAESTPCIDVKSIAVSGVTVFDYQLISAITSSYSSRCLHLEDINHLVADLSNLYLKEGYITSRAFVQPQKIDKGTLDVLVIEGEIESLQSTDGKMKAGELNAAFPKRRSHVVNDGMDNSAVKNLLYLRDLEQGIEQINRLRQNNAKLDIKPGKETGESIVYVVNERSLPLHATLSVDNSGSKQTGLYIVNAGVFWDNLVNRSDSLNFNISRSLNGEHGGSSQSYALNYSIPHGYFLWSVGANHFSYRQMIEGASINFKTTGKSDNQMIRMDHVVFRGQRSKVMWNIGATRKDTKNYIEDVFLETSSRTLYLADVGIQSTYQMESATLRGALEFTRSVAAGNATKKITAAEVDYQFSKYELDIGIYGRFGLSGRRFNYSSALHYFYTPTTIVASEALSLGGRYTVRGFDHESVTGFRGGYWRNDLSSSFFPTEQIRLEPFVALDVGHSDAPDYQQQSATLSGGSVGLRCVMRRFYAGVTYSKALSVPRFMARGQHELAAEMQMSF